MRKLFSFFAAILFAGSMMAEPVVINATDAVGIESGATGAFTQTLQGIKIDWEGAYYNNDNNQDFRVYASKTLALTATENISKVTIAGFAKKDLAPTVDHGTITTGASFDADATKSTLEDPLIVIENIASPTLTITCNKQMRAFSIEIVFGGETPIEPGEKTVVYNWSSLEAEQVGATVLGDDNETVGTVKIHTNTDELNCLKFAKSYVYADGKYVAIKPAEGGFKAGDEVSMSVVFSNSDETKYCMLDIYAADGDTRLFRSDSASTINGRLSAADPVVQTYTLEADQDSLLLGRYGNTTMCVTLLKVVRAGGIVPPTPADKYYVIGSMTGWEVNAAYELKANPAAEGEYMGEFDFEANAQLKVVKNDKETWYPDGMDNNYTIAEAGTYTVYFRPDGQGGEGWHYGFINAIKKEVPVVVEINCFEFYTKNVGDEVAMDELTVTYVNGANVYVKDATGALLIYLPKDVSVGWQPGSILKGVAGVVANYNGLYELKPSAVQVAAVEATLGEAPAPEEMTALPTVADVNKYVILKGVTVAATTFNDKKNLDATIAGQTFVLRNQFNADQVFEVNKVYDIIGAVAIYNDAIQIYFISAAGAQAIDNVDAAVKAIKTFENGRLVIIKNGVRYDATGARL